MSSYSKVDVAIWITMEDTEQGSLNVSKDGISLILESGKKFSNRTQRSVEYTVNSEIVPGTDGKSQCIPLARPIRISLNPQLLVYRPYQASTGQTIEDIYPQSTYGFYGRMKGEIDDCLYIIQNIRNDTRCWLTITNPTTNVIYEAYAIQYYEAEALSLIDIDAFKRSVYRDIGIEEISSAKQFMSILDDASPSWKNLSNLVSNVSIPGLEIKRTVRETMSQLVPNSFPDPIKEELTTFLAYVVRNKLITQDPVDLSFQLLSVPMLGALLRGHQRCMVDGTDWPPYVKLMTLAARGHLESPKRALPEFVKDSPWMLFWQKCIELFPNWINIAIRIAEELNQKGRLVTGLPTTRTDAKKSMNAWRNRLATTTYNLKLLGNIEPTSLGLSELVYIGAAYRWPHRHMRFIARLGSTGDNTQHLQLMTLPLNAAEQIRRVLPSAIGISWSIRTSNLKLLDKATNNWTVPTERIIDSLTEEQSMKRFQNRFNLKKNFNTQSISFNEAKAIDMIVPGVDLAELENPMYMKYFGFTNRQLRRILSDLIQRNIIQISYEVSDEHLLSLATIAQGKNQNIIALTESLLENTPTSLAMLTAEGSKAIILSKIPETSVYELARGLPKIGIEQGLNVRCMRPTTFKSYTHNLYQRLLRDDGTWDDDVSAFLSQARSKRRELSESNA